ncbi:ATP-dependent RNA helicase, putative [Plasmodium chabaudi chabaudi]|uniref:ATP-dependent RNA helicase, putative n=1 Tax=Plasmodium chabaudi chabaudi TaxID=31271 RepID=A0A1D3S0M5_PLACU|nr:ATP-dependent RNA helicase, putative [Plasmodium chabaudi chabaudi]
MMNNDKDDDNFFEEDDNYENNKNEKANDDNGQDEVDPLDEFMLEINKVIEEEKLKKEREEDIFNNKEIGSESENAIDSYAKSSRKWEKGKNINDTDQKYQIDKKNNNSNDAKDDNSLDDNDVTADIYEFLEKKNEELMNEKNKEKEHGKSFSSTQNYFVSAGTKDPQMEIKDDDSDFNDFLNDGNDKNKNDEIIICNINYDEIELEEFKKDIFVTDENINNFTLEQSVEYKKKNNIKTIGFNVPKPIFSFLQLKNIIDKEVLENMYELSISILSPAQSIVIPTFLSGRDFIANSRTGSGKTLAYIISLIIHLMNYKKESRKDTQKGVKKKNADPHALILTPTREICVQISEEINKISMNKLSSTLLFNGINFKNAYDDIHKGVDIIIANVKTLINFVNKKYLSLTNIKYVILDEFDKLFSNQFINSVISILNNIRTDSIRAFFSSTFSDSIHELVKPYLSKKHILIQVDDNNVLIDKKFYIVEESYKYKYLLHSIHQFSNNGQGFIFCNSKKNVLALYERLKKEIQLKHIKFDFIYGDMDQTDRLYKLDSLKNKRTQILISTGLMERGINVIDLNFVINYDCPRDLFVYIHRIGRCSRMNNKGYAVTFITPSEKKMAYLIYTHLKNSKETIDEELKNFILRSNLHNDAEIKKLKRKMNTPHYDNPMKKVGPTNSNNTVVSLGSMPFQASSSQKQNEKPPPKQVHMISPNDVLSSSSDEY